MTLKLRNLLPSSLRDAILPRLHGGDHVLETLPPWHAPDGRAMTLHAHRFEHGGLHHRLHVREHGDGSGLVIVDARRIARLEPAGMRALRDWLASGARDAAACERALWGEPVLTGEGRVRGVNAWEDSTRDGRPVPPVPIVATLEVAGGSEQETVARVRRLAELAVPHVVLRPFGESAATAVIAGVRAAEDLGLVTGVAAPADFLDDGSVVDDLAQAGLDHLALTLAGGDAALHDAVMGAGEHAKLVALARRAAASDVPLTAEVPLVAANWARIGEILEAAPALGMQGVTAWALVGDPPGTAPGALPESALRQAAATLEQASDRVSFPVTWAAPSRARHLAADIARGPRTDGDFGVRVTASGALLPPRATDASAGNVATATWDEVVASPAWQAFLTRARRAPRCGECPGLVLCTVDCPAAKEGWA